MLEEIYRQSKLFRQEQQQLAERERIAKHIQQIPRTRARRPGKQDISL